MKSLVVTCVMVAAVAAALGAQKTKYGVTVTAEKNVDFTKFKSYSWTRGQPSPSKSVDARIAAAVDRELTALGMQKAASGPGDVLVAYDSLTRTDLDATGKADERGNRPEYRVGILTVALLDPAKRQPLLRLRVDRPIEGESATLDEAIDSAVAEMFASYPTRKSK